MTDYCTLYHCAGDCGKQHGRSHVSDLARHRYKKMVMTTFDELTFDEQCKVLERRAEVERKARNQL